MAFPHDGKKFKKGESGNPKGRPTLKPLIEILKEVDPEQDSFREAIEQLKKKIAKGDQRAIEYYLNRFHGNPSQSTDITTDGEKIEQPGIIVLHGEPPKD